MERMLWLTDEELDFIRLATHDFVQREDGDQRRHDSELRDGLLSKFHSFGYDLTREVLPSTDHMNDWNRYLELHP